MSASAWFAEGGRIVERRYELDRRVAREQAARAARGEDDCGGPSLICHRRKFLGLPQSFWAAVVSLVLPMRRPRRRRTMELIYESHQRGALQSIAGSLFSSRNGDLVDSISGDAPGRVSTPAGRVSICVEDVASERTSALRGKIESKRGNIGLAGKARTTFRCC